VEKAKHIVVRGLVQGVGYRWFAAQRAEALGLRGSAVNQADGSVDIMAAGGEDALEAFVRLLGAGPRAAHVRDLSVEEISPGSIPSGPFTIR
jgi:acylphosphatase